MCTKPTPLYVRIYMRMFMCIRTAELELSSVKTALNLKNAAGNVPQQNRPNYGLHGWNINNYN